METDRDRQKDRNGTKNIVIGFARKHNIRFVLSNTDYPGVSLKRLRHVKYMPEPACFRICR